MVYSLEYKKTLIDIITIIPYCHDYWVGCLPTADRFARDSTVVYAGPLVNVRLQEGAGFRVMV